MTSHRAVFELFHLKVQNSCCFFPQQMSECETHVMEHTGFKCFFLFPFSAHKTVNAVLVIISTFYILLKKNRFHAVWLVRFAVCWVSVQCRFISRQRLHDQRSVNNKQRRHPRVMALINDAAPPNEALRQTKSTSIRQEVCEAGVTAACSHHLRASVERTTWRHGGGGHGQV